MTMPTKSLFPRENVGVVPAILARSHGEKSRNTPSHASSDDTRYFTLTREKGPCYGQFTPRSSVSPYEWSEKPRAASTDPIQPSRILSAAPENRDVFRFEAVSDSPRKRSSQFSDANLTCNDGARDKTHRFDGVHQFGVTRRFSEEGNNPLAWAPLDPKSTLGRGSGRKLALTNNRDAPMAPLSARPHVKEPDVSATPQLKEGESPLRPHTAVGIRVGNDRASHDKSVDAPSSHVDRACRNLGITKRSLSETPPKNNWFNASDTVLEKERTERIKSIANAWLNQAQERKPSAQKTDAESFSPPKRRSYRKSIPGIRKNEGETVRRNLAAPYEWLDVPQKEAYSLETPRYSKRICIPPYAVEARASKRKSFIPGPSQVYEEQFKSIETPRAIATPRNPLGILPGLSSSEALPSTRCLEPRTESALTNSNIQGRSDHYRYDRDNLTSSTKPAKPSSSYVEMIARREHAMIFSKERDCRAAPRYEPRYDFKAAPRVVANPKKCAAKEGHSIRRTIGAVR